MVIMLGAGGSMAICICTHTFVLGHRYVYTHRCGFCTYAHTPDSGPGARIHTSAICTVTLTSLSGAITCILVFRPRYVYTHIGSPDVCGEVVFRSSSHGPHKGPPRVLQGSSEGPPRVFQGSTKGPPRVPQGSHRGGPQGSPQGRGPPRVLRGSS